MLYKNVVPLDSFLTPIFSFSCFMLSIPIKVYSKIMYLDGQVENEGDPQERNQDVQILARTQNHQKDLEYININNYRNL